MRPGLLLAIAREKSTGAQREMFDSLWRRQMPADLSNPQIEHQFEELQAHERARAILETYKEEAIRSLRDLENPNLKGLLRRVIGKIFNDTEIKGWCKEFERKNADARMAAIAG